MIFKQSIQVSVLEVTFVGDDRTQVDISSICIPEKNLNKWS